MINVAIAKLIDYALSNELITEVDKIWAQNRILSVMKLDSFEQPQNDIKCDETLCDILKTLTDDAANRGLIDGESITCRDIFDTELMGCLTPAPHEVIAKFNELYSESPKKATDWYYGFSKATNYIRTDRIKKDMRWTTETEYGTIDITINLSKPEKDPRAIAAARNAASGYPKCQLCAENEGYSGRLDHPARQNHRMIPITVADKPWFLQYSPYVYYNEHCIVLNREHTPMSIGHDCFCKLLDFVDKFEHYFLGSNADLPIVGGSILSHDHFQGGGYSFAMEKAQIETPLSFNGYDDVTAGIVKWPMSVIRLSCADKNRTIALADEILAAWRSYSDESVGVFANTNGTPHNTITPIARKRNGNFELDLVLRNNITSTEHPLGVFHPHKELHHIKKENIGLIEVMGLAVLPARLKNELSAVADCLVNGKDLCENEQTAAHAKWATEIAEKYDITKDNVMDVLQKEVGIVFAKVLEHAGVFKRNDEGKAAFLRFANSVCE